MTSHASVDSTTGATSGDSSQSLQIAVNQAVGKFIGIPYLHNGRDCNGLDCLGLISAFYYEIGLQVPSGDGGPITPDWYRFDGGRYLRGLTGLGRPVKSDLEVADLVYFRLIDGHVTHGGIMVDRERFIHILEKRSVMVTRLTKAWRSRMAGARRFFEWQEQS